METNRGAVRTIAIAVAAGVLLGFWSAGCEDPLAPFNEITATSGSPQGGTVPLHAHQATIPARFVNEPPLDAVTLTTTSAGSPAHTHDVELSPAQLMDLQQNMALVNVASSGPSAGTNHFHSFLFER